MRYLVRKSSGHGNSRIVYEGRSKILANIVYYYHYTFGFGLGDKGGMIFEEFPEK